MNQAAAPLGAAVNSELYWNAVSDRVGLGRWLNLALPLTRSSSLRARSAEACVSEVCVGAEHPQARRGQTRRLRGGAEGVQHLCPLPDLADHSHPDPAADTHRFAGPGPLLAHVWPTVFLGTRGFLLASVKEGVCEPFLEAK